MEYLKDKLSLFRGRRQPQKPRERPNALQSSVLQKVPNEILLQITNLLPVAAAASFSISCMHLKERIGSQYLQKLAENSPNENLDYLDLLAHDHPNYIACPSCYGLHRMEYRKLSRPGAPKLKCMGVDFVEGSSILVISRKCTPTLFAMAMKQHQHNPLDNTFMKLLEEVNHLSSTSYYGEQSNVKCRINQNGFMIHLLQDVTASPEPTSPSFSIWEKSLRVCHHFYFLTNKTTLKVKTLQSPPRGSAPFSALWASSSVPLWSIPKAFIRHNTSSGVLRCHHCWTEFRFDFRHYPRRGIVMFFTRWKNLGRGPQDEIWKRHLQNWKDFPSDISQFRREEFSEAFRQSTEFEEDMFSAKSLERFFHAYEVRQREIATSYPKRYPLEKPKIDST